MKKRKFLGLVLTLTIVFSQFSALGTVFADGTSLSGRNDFLMGVNIHPSKGYHAQYTKTYNIIQDAKALGSNIVRTNLTFTDDNHAYDIGVADLAIKNGMKVYATSSFSYYENDNEGNEQPIAAADIDVAAITDRYTKAATALIGKVAYYQLGNEMNVHMHDTDYVNGQNASEFLDCSGIAVAIYAANKAIKTADPNAKTVVNFSWQNSGFIDAIKAVELDADTGLVATGSTINRTNVSWDIIGLNWYSNGTSKDHPDDYDDIISGLNNKYPSMPVIVSEAGLWPTSQNQDGSVNYVNDATWLENFLKYCYANQNVKGFIVYELYDQATSTGGEFNHELYHGLMDKDGNKKDVYNTICSLYGGTGVVNRENPAVPAINNVYELESVFSNNLTEGSIDTVYSIGDWLSVENTTTTDFTKGDFLEFDLFVEDSVAFKSALNKLDLDLKVQLYDNSGSFRDCRYISADYIKNDGWNHISISKNAFFDFSADWANINKVTISFYGTTAALNNYIEISGMKVAIANICLTKLSKPENVVNDGKIVIDEEGYSDVANRKVGFFTGYDGKTLPSVIDVSSCEKIEFDFYVENLEMFKKLTAEKELILKLLCNTEGSKQRQYYISKYVTKQGWNHITVNIDEYDYTQNWTNVIARYRLHFNGNSTDEISYPAAYFYFTNFNATKISVPELPKFVNTVISKDCVTTDYGKDKYLNYTNQANALIAITPVDISDSEFIECDIYVSDVNSFNSYLTGEHMCLILYTGDDSRLQTAFFDITEAVTHTGWNHFKFAKSVGRVRGGGTAAFNWTDVDKVGLGTYNHNATAFSGTTTGKAILANVCGTMDEINFLPELPSNSDVVISKDCVTTDYGKGIYLLYNNNPQCNAQIAITPVDISASEFIECDIYVSDVNSFNSYLTGEQMCLILYTGDDSRLQTAFFEIKEEVTHTGWNHFKFAKSVGRVRGGGTAAFNWTDVDKVGLGTYNHNATAFSGTTTGKAKLANVCGTIDLTVPSVAVNEKTDIIGSVLKRVEFDADGLFSNDITLNITNTRMVELDVYVGSNSVSSIEVELADNVDGYALYQFDNLASGWNHLTMRLSDGVDEDGNTAEIDLTNISSFAFYGTANASVVVSNFYVANYLDGDANRDGNVNVKDLVGMKKYIAKLASSNNIKYNLVAMDLSGNDYTINAFDLNILRRYLLSGSWS